MPEELSSPSNEDGRIPYFGSDPLWTPEIERQTAFVANCIYADYPGVGIFGTQRNGKTLFGIALKKMLPKVLNLTLEVQLWSFLGSGIKNQVEFLQTCLSSSGCSANTARSLPVLQDRLVNHLHRLIVASAAQKFVLVADEAQNLPDYGYSELMKVTGELALRGIPSTVVSIGQPEMEMTYDMYLQQASIQMIGRFFPQTSHFRGLSGGDIEQFLENMEGGEGQCEFSQAHFPKRLANGWTIRLLATPFQNAIKRVTTDLNLTRDFLFPMGYLRPTLIQVFSSLEDGLEDASKIDDLVYECVKNSGLLKVARFYVDDRP